MSEQERSTPLPDRIQDLADRILTDLQASVDDYEHTKIAWRVMQELPEATLPLGFENMGTSTIEGETGLGQLAQRDT